MEIVKAYPPNYKQITEAIPGVLAQEKVVFAYGDTIYNPSGYDIEDHLELHESVHAAQQKKIGVDEWWSKYLSDTKFRLEQEIEAYRAQYAMVSRVYGRANATALLQDVSRDLSSPMYGSILDHKQARKAILKK